MRFIPLFLLPFFAPERADRSAAQGAKIKLSQIIILSHNLIYGTERGSYVR